MAHNLDLNTYHVTVNLKEKEQKARYRRNLNTSHVTVNHLFNVNNSTRLTDLNTSHVTVNRGECVICKDNCGFKYIPCYC